MANGRAICERTDFRNSFFAALWTKNGAAAGLEERFRVSAGVPRHLDVEWSEFGEVLEDVCAVAYEMAQARKPATIYAER